jgi:hypothetical protein
MSMRIEAAGRDDACDDEGKADAGISQGPS